MTTEFLTSEGPDSASARRFLEQLAEVDDSATALLSKDAALRSDVLTLAAYSSLFQAAFLQDPGHIGWLKRERTDTRVRDKQTLLESLGRFSLTHSSLEPKVILARFRKRELMRIFLRDVRRLAAIAEITEEISNLADAVLEHALRLARQEMDNRFGQPQVQDEHGRIRPAEFCIAALGKLGSRELNYSSDIDLLFLFSRNGTTSGTGARGATTNLEYFSRLTQAVINLVGGQGGEGAAYRVDMRLRPHGRVGPLVLTLEDTIRYYRTAAAPWERQVLIRSRSSAGSDELFQQFYRAVEDAVFSTDVSVETALSNVARSKQKIDLQKAEVNGTDIKLGTGGIREIEFIAQALQLAYGGKDEWLRVPHTLISLDRLAQRGRLNSQELAKLFEAYDFFRQLEHILQIEDGLQTHLVPRDIAKRISVAKRFGSVLEDFDSRLEQHRTNVHRIFRRIFDKDESETRTDEKTGLAVAEDDPHKAIKRKLEEQAPKFLEVVNAHPDALETIADPAGQLPERDYVQVLQNAVSSAKSFGDALSLLRRTWYRQLIEIVVFDAFGRLELSECKRLQTLLAEAAIETALSIAKKEAARRFKPLDDTPLAVLALGKLGSGSLDYFSDLDLVFVHGDKADQKAPAGTTTEYYSRVVEIFSTVLSAITRDGHLYRVDLRLRPHGSDGPLVISQEAAVEYFQQEAAIWELLAYVNLRAVCGDSTFEQIVEREIRSVIHARGRELDPGELASETRLVRDKLEKRNAAKRSNEIDFKYGPGGLLDVYFAVRFVQLRLDSRDDGPLRSTGETLLRMLDDPKASPYKESIRSLLDGYHVLSRLDHSTRSSYGRSSCVSNSNPFVAPALHGHGPAGSANAEAGEFILLLLGIREAFNNILRDS